MADSLPLFREQITNANLSSHNADFAYFRLGYFSVKQRSKMSIIVSNFPSKHDDLSCKARVVIEEILIK